MNDLLSINQLKKNEINSIVEKAIQLKALGEKNKRNKLDNLVVASLFFEPSTRTRLSFESAILLAGGHYIDMGDVNNTSLAKGEDFYDTIRMVEAYSHIIIIRHSESGAASKAADIANIPVINAGDGENEHPTQALQDIMTIYENCGDITTLSIGIIGDLKYGRAVHSFVYALIKLKVKKIVFIASNGLYIPEKIKKMLFLAKIPFEECDDLQVELSNLDLLYVTRIQKERFEKNDYKTTSFYEVSTDILKKNPNIKIMHPFPRVDELSRKFDSYPNALYFQQAKNGVYIRQILLELLYKGGEI